MRKPLLAGNWKMYKNTGEAVELVEGLKKNLGGVTDREILVCTPFTALYAVGRALKGSNIKLGAQNLFWEPKGAYTGEIAPGMLVDTGCSYAIIGHSERRQYFGENDGSVNKKMKAAFSAGLTPIVCVGETLQEREQNVTFKVIERQVNTGIEGLDEEQAKKLVIAYEPVWAIGTGKTATPQQAEEVHAYIRKLYLKLYGNAASDAVRILYGGSVKPDNTSELMKEPNIDGGLVGGASLEVDSFTKIVKYKV
ncbi:MAG: triose-phosphate isomerase [Endomicrobiales bacterium]|nr:triose-phosphate isomerase [Endomicrobiales bacterium]